MTKTERQIAAAMSGLIEGKTVTWFFGKPENAAAMSVRFVETLQKIPTGGFCYRRTSEQNELVHEVRAGQGSVRFVTLTRPERALGVAPPILYYDQREFTEQTYRFLLSRVGKQKR